MYNSFSDLYEVNPCLRGYYYDKRWIPPGFTPLKDVVERTGKTLFGKKWDGFEKHARASSLSKRTGEETDFSFFVKITKNKTGKKYWNLPDTGISNFKDYENFELRFEDENSAKEQWSLLIKALAHCKKVETERLKRYEKTCEILRLAFYYQICSTSVLEAKGEIKLIPKSYWATNLARATFKVAAYQSPYSDRPFEGRSEYTNPVYWNEENNLSPEMIGFCVLKSTEVDKKLFPGGKLIPFPKPEDTKCINIDAIEDMFVNAPYMQLMIDAMHHFRAKLINQTEKKQLFEDWLYKEGQNRFGSAFSKSKAESMATFIRPPDFERGGNKRIK